MKSNTFWCFLLFIALLTFCSCDKDFDDNSHDPNEDMEETSHTDDENEDQDGRELLDGERILSISLTDAPTDLQAVNVDIVGMQIVTDDDSQFELSTIQGVYNLLDFQNGIDTLISFDTLSINFIKEIVLELGDNNTVIDNDGMEHPLELPSANKAYLVISVKESLDDLQLMDIQLDFDACQSVQETESGRWILKPVIYINTINDRPFDDIELDLGPDKISMIMTTYLDFDVFDINRKNYCFIANEVVKVEMTSSISDEQQTFLLNAECDQLYRVKYQDLSEIANNIIVSTNDILGGSADLFKNVNIYTSFNNELVYGFMAMKGQGSSAQEVSIYIDESGTLICTE